MLSVICCLLSVICYLLSVICYLFSVICCLLLFLLVILSSALFGTFCERFRLHTSSIKIYQFSLIMSYNYYYPKINFTLHKLNSLEELKLLISLKNIVLGEFINTMKLRLLYTVITRKLWNSKTTL